MLPLQSPGTHVLRMPQKGQQTTTILKSTTAEVQQTATTSNIEVAAIKIETNEEKVNRLVAELKGLNDGVQDKVLNRAFTGLEDF